MKQLLVILVVNLMFCLQGLNAQTNYNPTYSSNNTAVYSVIPSYTSAEIKERLNRLQNSVIKPYFDNIVMSYVKTYTVLKRDRTEKMIGRATMYFPIFEKVLEQKRMPKDLKYLSVLESALNPVAVSRSGARGLWQFMPATGKECGLSINKMVDERSDPHKATAAAADYLSRLYYSYGDWKLALAAYNGGPGRVNRAIKRGRSKNFHRIQKYLPKETRNYVSAFVSACYIMNNYGDHNMNPQYPDYDLRHTGTVKVFDRISFEEISRITGVPMQAIETLNPSYLKGIISASRTGNYLILPDHIMASFLNYLGRPDAQYYPNIASSPILAPVQKQNTQQVVDVAQVPDLSKHFKTTYVVKEGDNLEEISKALNCSKHELIVWNNLKTMQLSKQQVLTVYFPKENRKTMSGFSRLETIMPGLIDVQKKELISPITAKYPVKKEKRSKLFKKKRLNKNQTREVFYQIRRRETLIDIAEKFPGVSVKEIMAQNSIGANYILVPGTLLKIKVKTF